VNQPDLFTTAPRFDGATFDVAEDGDRLRAQLQRVKRLMGDHAWRTLAEIEAATGYPQASVSARLRDLRKSKFGGLTVERRRVDGARGLFEYRVT
jgi:hypothetical protein